MECINEQYCKDCSSNCGVDKGMFVLNRALGGESILFSTQRSHLVFVRSGRLRVRSEVFGESICLSNQIFLLTERSSYDVFVLEDCEVLSLSFIRAFQVCDVIRIDSIRESLRGSSYQFHTLEMNDEMSSFVNSMFRYLEFGVNCAHLHTSKQAELFVVCRYYYPSESIFKFFRPVFDRDICFESLVRSNCSQAKNVEQLAKLCGYNVHTFKKLFNRYFNESPYQWMQQQSAHRIKAMLMDKQIPIKVIVAEFGFTNQSHLNLLCKRRWGVTARQLRSELTQL